MKNIILFLTIFATISVSAQIHVAPTASGAGNGSNWANASTLENAISTATNGTSIWLRAGTYNLTSTLMVPNGVRVFGGFAGTEAQIGQRNFAVNKTILDAQHQFGAVHLNAQAVLNGVTVQNGVANSSSRMNGGGVLMEAGSKIEYCYIINNVATNNGGGIYVVANAEVFNSVIANNRAGNSGLAIYGDDVLFRNNTVVDNSALNCDGLTNETFQREICSGETITLTATVSGTYSWSTGATTASITTPALTANTTRTVTISTPAFCVVEQTFEITVKPKPTVTIQTDRTSANPGVMCRFTAIASPSGGTYLWNNTPASTDTFIIEQMPATGDLQFTVTYQLNGCQAEPATASITNSNCFPPVITPGTTTLTANNPTICFGDSTLLSLTGGTRNSGEWVLYSETCGGTEVTRTNLNNPTFWVKPTANTTYFLRGEGCENEVTECLSVSITINPLPMAITGSETSVCIRQNLVLNNATAGGGTWSVGLSGNISITSSTANSATITGLVEGTETVTFTATNGCKSFKEITVLVSPSAIVGDTNICQGLTQTFSATPVGGTWSITGGTSATVNTSGVVTASTTNFGAVTLSYEHPTTGCKATQTVEVRQKPTKPSAISNEICMNDSIALNPATPIGGTWTITPTSIAQFNADFSRIRGVAVGNATVRYALEHCSDTFHITVKPSVTSLTYPLAVCVGRTLHATANPTGGTWATTLPAIATVDTDGNFTGISAGTFALVYTLGNGCSRTSTNITVNPTPEPIAGENTVCVGLTTQLTSSAGGTWTSQNTSVATIDPSTGLVTGVSAGTATIRYTFSTGSCYVEYQITVVSRATITLAQGTAVQSLCLNAPLTNIVYTLTNATTTQIVWKDNSETVITQPTGINYNTSTRTISGTPTVSGIFNYTISTTDHHEVCSPATATGTITIIVPDAPIGTGDTLCATTAQRVNVFATSAGNQIHWFSTATGGVPLTTGIPTTGITNSGEIWQTPSISTPETYYAQAVTPQGCVSTRTAVIANVGTTPTITWQPSTDEKLICPRVTFPTISVAISPSFGITCQWYITTDPTNRDGSTPSTGTNTTSQNNFVPENTIPLAVPHYFYFIATHTASGCTTVSNVSGAHEVIGNIEVAQWCGTEATGPPTSFNFGTVSFASTQEWTIQGTGANAHISQIWSDAVTTTNCNKFCFHGGTSPNFHVDCRSNPTHKGDFFSWCAVNRHASTLCPHPWRVPTQQDFIDLDIAMGGSGNNRNDLTFITNNYRNRWGSDFGALCSGNGDIPPSYLGVWGFYWTAEHISEEQANFLQLRAGAGSNPLGILLRNTQRKDQGFSLRCIRDL